MDLTWKPPPAPVALDLTFLKRDVQNQRRIAQHCLDSATSIQQRLDAAPGSPESKALEEFRNTFLEVAKELAQNANETSSTATTVITKVTSASS